MKQRLLSIDLVKIVAMFAVIGLHTFCGSRGYELAHLSYMSCVVGVPFFFMSSGYLLLGRTDLSRHYVIIKIWHIIRLIFLIALVYSFFAFLIIDVNPFLLFVDCISGVIIQSGDLWICWYLVAMMMVYIVYPLINKLYLHNFNVFLSFLFFLLLIESIVFYLNVFWNGWESNIVQTIRFWNWLFYFCLGGFLKKLCNVRTNQILLFLVFLFTLVCYYFFHEFFAKKIGEDACEYYYSFIVVILMVTSAFLYITRVKIKPIMYKPIRIMSRLFLPVYLLHPFVLSAIIRPNVSSIIYANWMPFYFSKFLIVSIVTLLLSDILLKIPNVNKYLRI